MSCPACRAPSLVLATDWRTFVHLAGVELDDQVLIAGLHAAVDPSVDIWTYFACLSCCAQGVLTIDREAVQS